MDYPELIICGNEIRVSQIRSQVKDFSHIKVIGKPSLHNLMGIAPRRVTVLHGVPLHRDLEGEGSLLAIIKKRQLTWGDQAILIIQ